MKMTKETAALCIMDEETTNRTLNSKNVQRQITSDETV